MGTTATHPSVFISYSSKDVKWCDDLRTILAPVVRAEIASVWWDGMIRPSQIWRQEIETALASARLAILLVSKNFLASDFIQNEELPFLLDAAERRGVKLLWILIGPCLHEHSPLRHVQAAHKPLIPLSKLRPAKRDEALTSIGRAVAEALLSVEDTDQVNCVPYRGLAPFQVKHARFFFGRKALTERLLDALRKHPFLAVLGPSGSGKSSVVQAGLIPALKRGEIRGSAGWEILAFTPGRNPLKELAIRLLPYTTDRDASQSEKIDRLSSAMLSDRSALATEIRSLSRSKILFIIDQFEELFAHTTSKEDRLSFCQNLLGAAGHSAAQASIVLTLRVDFYLAVIKEFPEFADQISAHQIIVKDLQENDLWEAIAKPAELAGLRFEDNLVEEILKEAKGQAVALPSLQQALFDLWEKRDGDTLTFAAYTAIGGVRGSITKSAESGYKELSENQQALARKIFVKLVKAGNHTEDTRLRLSQKELATALKWEPAYEIDQTVERLIQARLLITEGDSLTSDSLVEIAHESLLQEWPRLREWLEASRSSRLRHSRIQARSSDWLMYNREEESLLRGAALAEFELWSHEEGVELGALEREYLDASLDFRRAEAQEKESFQKLYSSMRNFTLLDRQPAAQSPRPLAAKVHAEITTTSTDDQYLPRTPDLEIAIRTDTPGTLLFEVRSPDPEQRINARSLKTVSLGITPGRILHYLFRDIEDLPLDTEENRLLAEQKLAIKGLAIWELFPRELQDLLWNWRRSARTLLIQSDETYIPWEIAKLEGRDRDGLVVPGPFLCEAFAVTRWLRGTSLKTRLSLQNLAFVASQKAEHPWVAQECNEIRTLAERYGGQVSEIEPKYQPVCDALASGIHDSWHFAGHGLAIGDDSDRWSIELDGFSHFSAEDLQGEAAKLGLTRPLVFFNGCTTSRSGLTLTGLGGWPQQFLRANAGAFIGTYWAVSDDKAREFAVAVYEGLLDGLAIGEAFRRARRNLHKKYPGDPTWLAYTVFAYPLAGRTASAPPGRPIGRSPLQLTVPVLPWRMGIDSPGALLRAQYGVVPFHRRDKELGDLLDWCLDSSPVKVRLYTGPGGMGKTRLALEAALRMKKEGWWTGFVTDGAMKSPEKTWKALARPEGKLLFIVDYAETNRPFLIPVLREMYRLERGPVRLILLARAALDWWEQLKSERDGVGELLSSPATSRCSLQPLSDSVDDRLSTYQIATRAFSERLQAPLPPLPDDLSADYFQNAALLQMKALIDLEGEDKAKGEDHILDRILERERKFWATRTDDHGLPRSVANHIGRAMTVITLGGGVQGEAEALETLRGLKVFADQPTAVLAGVARLLHECYPGERWIEPLHPDLLGEHLAQRELEKGADELFDLVLGPRSGE